MLSDDNLRTTKPSQIYWPHLVGWEKRLGFVNNLVILYIFKRDTGNTTHITAGTRLRCWSYTHHTHVPLLLLANTNGIVFTPATSTTTFVLIKWCWAANYGSFVAPFGVNACCRRWNPLVLFFFPFFSADSLGLCQQQNHHHWKSHHSIKKTFQEQSLNWMTQRQQYPWVVDLLNIQCILRWNKERVELGTGELSGCRLFRNCVLYDRRYHS